ncbi:hypothetical protein K438DRAFT_2036938 [Mycena galopus ATCC 62051]|nr:hypothetical protein K438DRAFT_2036938 [Mycena galopus ATCC 62051]
MGAGSVPCPPFCQRKRIQRVAREEVDSTEIADPEHERLSKNLAVSGSENDPHVEQPTSNQTTKIPEEILLVIFRHALPPSWAVHYGGTLPPFPRTGSSADVGTKLSILKVCKRWHRIGLEFMYEDVTLQWIGQLPVFVRALETGAEVGVGALVRRLEIGYWVPRGYHALQAAEIEKIFELCPLLTHFAFNPQLIPSGPLPTFPLAPILRDGSSGGIRVTHLEISHSIEYPTVLPALVELCPTLKSLSLLLPTSYDTGHPTLTFPHLENFRLGLAAKSLLPGSYWVIPNLRQLLIHPTLGYFRMNYSTVCTFLGAYGRTLKVLDLQHQHIIHRGAVFDVRQLLLRCPILEHLSVNENCHSDKPEYPEAPGSADIFNERSRLEFANLKTTFPTLRTCRYIDAESNLFPDLPPIHGGGVNSNTDYIMPENSYLELFSEVGSTNDSSDDSDYVLDLADDDDGSVEASESDSSDSTDYHNFWNLPTAESDDEDWEVDREEVVAIFRRTLIK